jgi:hypothetical protein
MPAAIARPTSEDRYRSILRAPGVAPNRSRLLRLVPPKGPSRCRFEKAGIEPNRSPLVRGSNGGGAVPERARHRRDRPAGFRGPTQIDPLSTAPLIRGNESPGFGLDDRSPTINHGTGRSPRKRDRSHTISFPAPAWAAAGLNQIAGQRFDSGWGRNRLIATRNISSRWSGFIGVPPVN